MPLSIPTTVRYHPPGMSDEPQPAESQPPRFSLERLSSAFARLMGAPKAGGAKKPEIAVVGGDEDDLVSDDAPLAVTPRMIVEGLLFVGRDDGRPMTAAELAGPIRNVEPSEIPDIVAQLNDGYRRDEAPYEIVPEGGGYRLQLRPAMAGVQERMRGQVRAARLTPSAIEVLSIVAYRQPVTSEQVTKSRGRRSQAILAQLVRRQLVQIDRSGEGRRTPRYATTERFNRLFGVAGPAELPRIEDLADG